MSDELMNTHYSWAEFDDQTLLATQLADDIAAQLNDGIARRGRAVLALSGGSTPAPVLKELCSRTVDWPKVVITLVDERWVDEKNELSNAAFVKQRLLSKLPAQTRFVSLYAAAENIESSLALVLADYCVATGSDPDNPAGFDVVVLGMGGDGHTASFFPDAVNIKELVNLHASTPLMTCESTSSQVPRVTWTLPMLLGTEMLALHFTGETKKKVFEAAIIGQDATELPIRSVIFQPTVPLNVYYAD